MKEVVTIILRGFFMGIFIFHYSIFLNAQYNTNLGYKAGDAVSSGQKNVMVGQHAGESNNGSGNIFIGSQAGQNVDGSNILIITNDTTKNTIYGDLDGQRVAIGTTDFPTDSSYRLAVEGKIIAREFKATQTPQWPDFVFNEDYPLPSIEALVKFIDDNNHLPDVPSCEEVALNGIELASMNATLLRKIEELTLYIIDQNNKLSSQNNKIESQEDSIQKLRTEMEEIKFTIQQIKN